MAQIFKKFFKVKKYSLLTLLAILIIVEAAFLLYPKVEQLVKGIPTSRSADYLQKYAAAILKQCAKASYRPTCYDEEIPKVMDYLSMEDAFKVTSLIQEEDQSYFYCHVLGHKLSARETAKDPSKWKDVVARAPVGVCSNGAIHGAFQERFRSEFLPSGKIDEFKEELAGVCEKRGNWNPTGLGQATCYHAVGHLLMYVTNANINTATDLCDELTSREGRLDLAPLCYDGAFMQIFQPLEAEDFALIKGKQPSRDELIGFCSAFTGAKKGSCLSEGWPLFRDEIKTASGLENFCSLQEAEYLARCYNAMFYVITPQLDFNQVRLEAFCRQIGNDFRGRCFANAASRMIETDSRMIDRAVSLCTAADSLGVDEVCWQELLTYSTYNFHAGSEEFFKLCNKLPEGWKDQCLAQS